MILNPPHIIALLRIYTRLRTHELPEEQATAAVAKLLRTLIGHQSYNAFLGTYQLYLQSIPLALAKSAWGLNAANQSNPNPPNP